MPRIVSGSPPATLSDGMPKAVGAVGNAGTKLDVSRSDHIHAGTGLFQAIATDATPAATSVFTWTALHSQNISAPIAHSAKGILVLAQVGGIFSNSGFGGNQDEPRVRVAISSTPCGTPWTFIGLLGNMTAEGALIITLIQGVDYTDGVAFTIDIEGELNRVGTGGVGATASYFSSAILQIW